MMKKPKNIPLSEFDYDLPDNKIAVFPLKERDKSRLLIYNNGSISDKKFHDLPSLLSEEHRLIFNDTKVIHARLKFRKKTGAVIEIFCLEPINPADYQMSFSSDKSVIWNCMAGNIKKWKDEVLEKEVAWEDKKVKIFADKISREGNTVKVRFNWSPDSLSFSEILELSGETPIPPYLRREAVPEDSETYQTIYSRYEGSVAAPTAGLHFTDQVLSELKEQNVEQTYITLHVGAGTFTPVKDENAVNHFMHREKFNVEIEALRSLLNEDKKTVAVGTTSCRCIESIYWIGVKMIHGTHKTPADFLAQWEAYDLPQDVPRKDALNALIDFMTENEISQFEASTEIMIAPGYEFKMMDVLITNFHQPSSTLLMLIAAFTGGNEWKKIYRYALENNFRFLSYGDSSILF